uniref:Uncharacterized protein n=1 Tax=Janibacter limosus TaxID=53458 RepID=A0AC61U4Z0_9MICO|nr:hypothetical protein [Janibacter limosus]
MADLRRLRDRLVRRLGRGGTTSGPVAPGDEEAMARLAELTSAGRHEEALAPAHEEYQRTARQSDPDKALLRQIQMSASKAGNLSLHIKTLRRRIEVAPHDTGLPKYLRAAEGRWNESEPGWLPTIDPAILADLPEPAPRDRSRTRVLHLLKIGMPQRQSGYSMRSMYTPDGPGRRRAGPGGRDRAGLPSEHRRRGGPRRGGRRTSALPAPAARQHPRQGAVGRVPDRLCHRACSGGRSGVARSHPRPLGPPRDRGSTRCDLRRPSPRHPRRVRGSRILRGPVDQGH